MLQLSQAMLHNPLLRAVLVTTSIADWTPSLDPIRATLRSLECLDAAETLVIADALPSPQEAETLSPLDGDKWRALYVEKDQAYETYLCDLQKLCDARPATRLLRQETFGHLVGSVRAGFESLALDADDVVLVTQHDLALQRAPPVQDVCDLLRGDGVDYVLLSRDADAAPRFVSWFYPDEAAFSNAKRLSRGLATLVDLEGGYADQTHFATKRWYDETVFPRLPPKGTCMEHVLHPVPVSRGEASVLKGGTFALEHGPHLRDAVHGLVTRHVRKYLPGLAWKSVSDIDATPGDWSQVFWRRNRWAGAANKVDGDYSRRADLVAVSEETCRWRIVDERARPVRTVCIGGATIYASFNASVEAFAVQDGRPVKTPVHCEAPVMALAASHGEVYAGGLDRRAQCLSSGWTGPALSGWARALTILEDGSLVQAACEAAVVLREGALFKTIDAGPTSQNEEAWRRHDICALGASERYLVGGLVDGSVRRWSVDDWSMEVLPGALLGRAVGVAVYGDGFIACDASTVRRWGTLASEAVEWEAPAKLGAFASSGGMLAVGLADGAVWLLDAATLAPRRRVEASETSVASVALGDGVLVVGGAEGVVVAFDV